MADIFFKEIAVKNFNNKTAKRLEVDNTKAILFTNECKISYENGRVSFERKSK